MTPNPPKVQVQCGNCKARYRVDARVVGRVARCPACRHHFVLAPKPTLDDSVVDWLLDDENAAHDATARPEAGKQGAAPKA